MEFKCCWGCKAPKRYPGCHDHCPEHLAEKVPHEVRKASENKENAIRCGLDEQKNKAIYRAVKTNRRKWGC